MIVMKSFVFDGIMGVVAIVEASTMEEAIKIFDRKYPFETYACVYEK